MKYKITLSLIILSFTVLIQPVQGQRVFIHPGILHSQASLNHIAEVAQKETTPAFGSYKLLRDNSLSNGEYKMKGPFSIISRDGSYAYTKGKMEQDFSAAYLNALM